MRGVRKSRSPGDVGKHGHPQLSLKEAAEQLGDLLSGCPATEHAERARYAFDDLPKSKLRPLLLQEQRHLCIYCEVQVVEDPNKPPRVDHWEPLGRSPDLALEWSNLYLSCPRDTSCDVKKHGHRMVWDDADASLPPPCQREYERYLGFSRGGQVYVKRGANLTDAQRRALELAIDDRVDQGVLKESILGLNHPDLVAARKAALDRERSRIQRLFPNKRADPAAPELKSRAQSLLAASRRESFVSIRLAWLEGRIGEDRP
jgi:uncharacterized protein (TIGR02646 family)